MRGWSTSSLIGQDRGGNTLPISEPEGYCWVAENTAGLWLSLSHLLIYGAEITLICLGCAPLIIPWVCGGWTEGHSLLLCKCITPGQGRDTHVRIWTTVKPSYKYCIHIHIKYKVSTLLTKIGNGISMRGGKSAKISAKNVDKDIS